MKYELWHGQDGHYSFFAVDNDSARKMLDPDDRLIWTVEAQSWEEASQAQYDYLGWGEYRPFEHTHQPRNCIVELWFKLWERITNVLRLVA
jgi:hypothetical protein